MKITPLFLVFAFALLSCQNEETENVNAGSDPSPNTESTIDNSSTWNPVDEVDIPKENNSQTEAKNGETSSKKELKKPSTLYESVDINNFDFANSPFASTNHKKDLFKTNYIKIDTAIYPSPMDRNLKDTLIYFFYDDQSEISLLIRGKKNRIVFAALVSNILTFKDDIAMGMNKESFWTTHPNMDNIHRDFNILRITNEDKMIWVGLQFQDDVLAILEYHGSNLD